MSDTDNPSEDVQEALGRLRRSAERDTPADRATLSAVLKRVESQLEHLPELPVLPPGLLDDDWEP